MLNDQSLTEDRIIDVMRQCIEIAKKNQTPFGAAVISTHGELLGIAANQGRKEGPLSHAEMNVLSLVGKEKCDGAILISTCEPCPMCAGGAIWSKISRIYFGASIDDAAHYMNQIDISCQQVADQSWNPPKVTGGILVEDCRELFEMTRKTS